MAAPAWALAKQWWHAPEQPLVWWKRTFEEGLVPPVQLGPSGQLELARLR